MTGAGATVDPGPDLPLPLAVQEPTDVEAREPTDAETHGPTDAETRGPTDAETHGPTGVEAREMAGAAPVAPARGRLRTAVAAADSGLTVLTEVVVAVALAGELVVMFGNIIARTFFHSPWLWSDEVGSDMLSIIAFLGAAISVQRGQVIAVEALTDRLRPAHRQVALAIGDWIVVAAGISLIILSQNFLDIGRTATAPNLPISAFWTELAFPVGIGLFVVNVLRCRLRTYPWKVTLTTGVLVLAGALALWVGYQNGTLGLDNGGSLVVILVAFAVMVLLGMPIMFAFVVAAMLFLMLSQAVDVNTIPAKVWHSPRNPILLALPFFTWVGFIMTRGGLSSYLARFISNLVDHLRGGVLHVVVVVMYVFSGISGSKTADMAAVSATLKDAMGKSNDDGRFTAVLNTSAVMAETIPPSLGLIVAASVTSLSIISLFLAGLLPALALAACMMLVIYIQARLRKEERKPRAAFKEIGRSLALAFPTLTVPVLLIVGVVGGFSTPTEVSAVAVVYALLLTVVLYRKMTWSAMWALTVETISIAGMALFAQSTASAFSFTLTIAQVPESLGTWITNLNLGATVFLIACSLFMILMGAVLEGLPSLLIFVPLLYEPAMALGVNPIHFVIVMLIAIHIGTHAPPLGVSFYVACLLTKTKPAVVMRQNWIYLAVLTVGLLLLIVVPQASLFLPHVFGHG